MILMSVAGALFSALVQGEESLDLLPAAAAVLILPSTFALKFAPSTSVLPSVAPCAHLTPARTPPESFASNEPGIKLFLPVHAIPPSP